ncbi:MAG: hypothetical protein E6R03_14465 [Hyphomicrobiaceae bacterium]|nr:MAG: hypothetical protein E6R03_14465 [Hyphomicrobiaceae bacterium]
MKTPLPMLELVGKWAEARDLYFSSAVYVNIFRFGDHYYVRPGYTAGLYSRLNQHVNAAPEWPIFIKVFAFHDETQARECERFIISLLKPYRTKGDWFRMHGNTHAKDTVNSAFGAVRQCFPYREHMNEFEIINVSDELYGRQYEARTFDGVLRTKPGTREVIFTSNNSDKKR